MLKRINKPDLYHYVNDVIVAGPHKLMRGDCSGLYGDCTGLSGDCTGLKGDVNKHVEGEDETK